MRRFPRNGSRPQRPGKDAGQGDHDRLQQQRLGRRDALKPDWQKLDLGSPNGLVAANAVHSTGFRLEKAKDKDGKEVEKAVFFNRPEEYAKIEGEELVFPMTKWNYRMIVLERK